MTPKQTYNALIGKKTVLALKKRNFEAHYCHTKEEALELALSLVPNGSKVAWGGSVTLNEIGLLEHFRAGDFEVIDRDNAPTSEAKTVCAMQAFSSDYYFMSTNAITQGGILVNIDGVGNRAAALIYGPKNVVVITGINKLVTNEQTAIDRARKVAAPTNAIRLGRKNPCVSTGICHNCTEDECLCRNIVITRMSGGKSRIKVILVGEALGY